MPINISDNLQLSKPAPLRTTEVVGVDNTLYGPYNTKEEIPMGMRHLYMETIDNTGKKWVLRNSLDLGVWTAVALPEVPPSLDGLYILKKTGDSYTWEPNNAIIDIQEGPGIHIDKTDPKNPVISTIQTFFNVTYEELRALKDGDSLIPGMVYKITDFKTSWYLDTAGTPDIAIFSGDDIGINVYQFDTEIEPLYVTASSNNTLFEKATSDKYPLHRIKYSPEWDWMVLGHLIRAKVANPQGETDWEVVKKEDLGAGWNYRGGYDAATNTPDLTSAQTLVAIDDYWEVEVGGTFFSKKVKRDAPEQPTGKIYFRKDPGLDIETSFDYIGYRATRWAVTAPEYDPNRVYSRKETCSVPDPNDPTNRAKDALYISIKGTNTNHDPSDTANDGVWWALFRPAGVDGTGMYRDFVASDWTDINGYYTTDMSKTNTFGFQVVPDRFQNFPTFAFSKDLTIVDGKGGQYETFNYCKVYGTNCLFMSTDNSGSYYGNYFIDIGEENRGLTIVSGYIYSVTMKNMYGGTIKNYIFGAAWDMVIPYSVSWFQNNYFEGFSFIEGFANDDVSANFSNNISIKKGAARDASLTRSINGAKVALNNTLIYRSNWIHATSLLILSDCTILGGGSISHNSEIFLRDSTITGSVERSTLSSHSSYGSNVGVTITGSVTDSYLYSLKNVTIDGDLKFVEASDWDGVTIPSTKTFDRVKFYIPKWYGKNTWDTNISLYSEVIIDKKYIDNKSTPTVEKLWVRSVDVNGDVTYLEVL